MNWIAFFIVLLGIPLAGAVLGTVQVCVIRLLMFWFGTGEELREAVKGCFALFLLVTFATIVGVACK